MWIFSRLSYWSQVATMRKYNFFLVFYSFSVWNGSALIWSWFLVRSWYEPKWLSPNLSDRYHFNSTILKLKRAGLKEDIEHWHCLIVCSVYYFCVIIDNILRMFWRQRLMYQTQKNRSVIIRMKQKTSIWKVMVCVVHVFCTAFISIYVFSFFPLPPLPNKCTRTGLQSTTIQSHWNA